MIRKIIISCLILTYCSCYRISYKFTLDQGKTYRTEYWNNYFMYGFAPVKERYTFDELCPNGIPARLDSKISGANLLSSVFSLGFTGANTLNVQCIPKQCTAAPTAPVPKKPAENKPKKGK